MLGAHVFKYGPALVIIMFGAHVIDSVWLKLSHGNQDNQII
jgi:hypothetical protein